MRLTVLAGGIGGSTFLRGLLKARPDAEITVVGNTADDITLFGLRVCPDLDTVMYTLGGGISAERGWGREDETWVIKEELAAYGVEPTWFGLGDRDVATHLVRTQMLDAGYGLTAVTEALCARWKLPVRLLPMSDDRVETHVVVDDPEQPGPAQGHPLPGVLGPLARRGHRAPDRRRRPGEGEARARCAGCHRGLRRADRCRRPTPSSRSARSSAYRGSGTRSARRPRRSSGCRRSSAPVRSAAWPTRCSPPSVWPRPPRPWRGTTVRARPAAYWTAG